MYLMHLCSKEKDYDEENFFSPREAAATANLNSTETTTFMEEATVNEETVQLLNVKQRAEQYEQQTPQARKTPTNNPPVPNKPPIAPRPASIHKPLLPVKPTTQSLQNSTIVKPANQPPPPPPTTQVEVAVVHPNTSIQKTYSVKKPKAPPPPPPSENTENIYENKPKRTAPSPPTYQDVMNDIPVDNYLSDND